MLTLPAIPSAVTPEEAGKLAELAAGQVVLELGADNGFSTVVMARVAARVHSVDAHQGDPHAGMRDTLGAFMHNLLVYEVLDRVTVYAGRFEDVLPVLRPGVFGGVFIDGYHTAEAVRSDLDLALPLLAPGGWVAFHDYGRGPHNGFPTFGVTQVADEFGIDGSVGHLAWGWA